MPLAEKTWFKTGGLARFFCAPTTIDQCRNAIAFAQTNNLPITILGGGANVLIADTGIDGLVLYPKNCRLFIKEDGNDHIALIVGAGVNMDALISFCLHHNIIGLEEFSGIPSSIGGAVYINLHYYQFLLEQFLVSATVMNLTTGAIATVDNSWFNFAYDDSRLHKKEAFLIDATFKLQRATNTQTAFAHGRRLEIMRHRAKRYPTMRTCGSFFRNLHSHETTHEASGKKIIHSAYYLDAVGVRRDQLTIGGAQVSSRHANMIVTCEGARSDDIIKLAQLMQQRVYEQFGVTLQPECQLLGFSQNPFNLN